jgi:hypothetical protein
MNSEEKSRDGPRLVVVLLRLLLLPLKPPKPPGKLCLGESGDGIGEAGLFGQLHLLVARKLSGLDPSAGSKTG